MQHLPNSGESTQGREDEGPTRMLLAPRCKDVIQQFPLTYGLVEFQNLSVRYVHHTFE